MACSKRGLRLGAGAVDFVGHQELGEDRALDEAEGTASALLVFKHFRADDVGRHQIGRELDALAVKAEHATERFDEQGFRNTGNADQKTVAARQQR